MDVDLKTVVTVSARSLVEAMNHEELAEFCGFVASKLDADFVGRNNAAAEFSSGLSEDGCRFLAEAVAQHYMRNK